MSDAPPSIVWLTLDSVRYDGTTLGGYERDTTPRLADLAERRGGLSLSRCFAHGNWTLASSGAILSGTPPSHNTVGMDGERLPGSVPTVAERLRDAGYATACISRNSHVSEATALDRGFDRFEWLAADTLLSAAGPVTLAKYLLNLREHSAGLDTDTAKHATPYLVNEIAGGWLDELASERPFFLYAHYNEPHRPYHPPLAWLDRFADDLAEYDLTPEAAVEIAMDAHYDYTRLLAESSPEELPLSERELAALRIMYDTEVAYTDEMVGRLIEQVREADPNAVVIVTADHGELFGERGLLGHRLVLHDKLLHVPCVVSAPEGPADFHYSLTQATDDPVQHNDLTRTLLGAVGADTDGLGGVDLRDADREAVFASRNPVDFADLLAENPEFDTDRFHGPGFHCVRTADWKYQRGEAREELFALPDESTDVSVNNPDAHGRLSDLLDAFLAGEGRPVEEGRDARFTDAQREQLRDLGYVE